MSSENGYMYVAKKSGGETMTIVLNGREIGTYAEVRESSMTPGGSWGASVMKKRGNSMYPAVIVNGKEYEGESLRLIEQGGAYEFTWLKYTDTDEVMLQSLKAAK